MKGFAFCLLLLGVFSVINSFEQSESKETETDEAKNVQKRGIPQLGHLNAAGVPVS